MMIKYNGHLKESSQVQVLNHISNSAHPIVEEFEFSGGGYECQQVTDETQPEYGFWCDQFIMHKVLPYNTITKSQYSI